MKEFFRFLKHIRIWYLLFVALIIIGLVFGGFEIVHATLLKDTPEETIRWLHFTRGVTVALILMIWAAWTVYNYRELYEDQLEATRLRYRDIIEHSADAILSIDQNNIIHSWNRGAEDMLGWKREEIVGQPVFQIIPRVLMEQGEPEAIDSIMELKGYVQHYETERLTKGGETKLVQLTESYIRNKKDKIIGRSQILRDMTDFKLREEQIQQSERLATVGHMAAGVAHEVGNPLTAISSLVQVCQRKTDDPFVYDQLKKVRQHIQRITKIVRDLVDFSRPSSHKTESTQINDIILSAVGLLQHDARCRDVEFSLDLSSDLPKIRCVPDQIHQVLVNLLLNAVDAMEHVKDPVVSISTDRKGSFIRLVVSDIGKGIKKEHKARIFEPFFTTKEVGSGTGLGLSVSHGIVTKLGGTIRVNSEVGKGSSFTIDLPLNTESKH